jgi:tyrosine ammonia-lyase
MTATNTNARITFSNDWSLKDLMAVGCQDQLPVMTPIDLEKIEVGHKTLIKLIEEGYWIYGVTSGFGPLAIEEASHNLHRQQRLIYHLATGVGPLLSPDLVRMIFALRLKQLAQGFSGIHPVTFKNLYEAFKLDFLPEIPALGSVGASGDLTPLAHLALGLSGKSAFSWKGEHYNESDFDAMKIMPPISWRDKDALAFVNGNAAMTAIAAKNLSDFKSLLKLSCQLAFSYAECLGAYRVAWHPKLAKLHPQKGHRELSEWLYECSAMGWFQEGPRTLESTFKGKWPQDPYSVRCIPQLLGAVKDQLQQVDNCIHIEINSVSDNPNFFSDDNSVIHGGNFNGQHLSFASDQLNLQMAYLGIYAEKRISTLCDPKLNLGLPAFLKSGNTGENSGFMGAQVTATALSAELKSLYKPLSLETLSTNGQNQDMVSMGTASACRGRQMLDLLKTMVSIECMVVSEALRQRKLQIKRPPSLQSTHFLECMNPHFKPLSEDRPLSAEIEQLAKRIIQLAQDHPGLPE